jgi:hypothetical protein
LRKSFIVCFAQAFGLTDDVTGLREVHKDKGPGLLETQILLEATEETEPTENPFSVSSVVFC